MNYFQWLLLFICSVCLACGQPRDPSSELTVYTSRHYAADDSLYAEFQRETGIKIREVKNKDDTLINRLLTEGAQADADVLITADAARLHRAKELGLLQPVKSQKLDQLVGESLRDPEHHWYSLTIRARVIVHRKDFDADALKNYLDLSDPQWRGSVLVRKSNHVYNQSLVASMIATYGKAQVKTWLQGLVANFARNPSGNDRSQVLALSKGEGDFAIVNSYYLGKMMAATEEKDQNWQEQNEAFARVQVMFPDQGFEAHGTHVNITGAGVCKGTDNAKDSIRFIEYLVSDPAQQVFAATNFEYPIRSDIEVANVLKSWGDFKRNLSGIRDAGIHSKQALMLMQEAGWH